MTTEVSEAQGRQVNHKRVARVMREHGLQSHKRRRFRVVTTDSKHAHPVAPNVLGRDFEATAPNQKWLADMTYVPTKEGWLYLALVLDLYARKLVGWAMSETMPQELTLSALDVALGWRDPDAGLVHHSDRGSQYAAKDYRSKLKARGITVSMSRKGDCWDNAQRLGLGKAKANTVGSQIAEVAAEDTDLVGRRLAPAGSRFEPDLPFHGAASCTSKAKSVSRPAVAAQVLSTPAGCRVRVS